MHRRAEEKHAGCAASTCLGKNDVSQVPFPALELHLTKDELKQALEGSNESLATML